MYQTANANCVICNARDNLRRLSIACRVNIFIERNIYVSEDVRSCSHHLDDDGLLQRIHLPALRSINRPCIIRGPQIFAFLNQLRDVFVNKTRCIDENDLSDDDFQCIAPMTKQQFEDILTYCDSVLQNGKLRYISKKDLLAFLCKIIQGLSDNF